MDKMLQWLDDINESVKDVDRKADDVNTNTNSMDRKMDEVIELLKDIKKLLKER